MKKRVFALLLIVVVIGLFLLATIHPDHLPQVSVDIITEDDYLQGFDRNTSNSIQNTNYSHVTYPTNASRFCEIIIKDYGYSDDLPIDLNIYFALGDEGLLLNDSYFCIANMPDSQQYANVFVELDNSSPNRENIYLDIVSSVVALYDSSGVIKQSIPYEYHAFGCVNLSTLETVEFNSTQNSRM